MYETFSPVYKWIIGSQKSTNQLETSPTSALHTKIIQLKKHGKENEEEDAKLCSEAKKHLELVCVGVQPQ